MSPQTLNLTGESFKEAVIESDLPVLVDFWAVWCGPCRMVGPVVDELAAEYAGRLKVGKVDVDAEPALAAEYGIQGIPALTFFWHGEVVDQVLGAVDRSRLVQKVEEVLAVTAGAAGVTA